MRTLLMCTVALAIGFASGGYVSVPFFRATDSTAPAIPSTPNDTVYGVDGKPPCQPAIPDNLPNVEVAPPQTVATNTSDAGIIASKPNEEVGRIEVQNSAPLVAKTTVIAEPAPLPTPTPKMTESEYATEIQNLIIAATTKVRQSESLAAFTTDTALERSAKKYSAELRAGNYLAHIDTAGCDLTCRFSDSGYSARSWGENLAMMEYEEQPSAAYVANFFMTQWQKSSGHRKNLLSPTFTHQGVGVSVQNGKVYVVVHFALPL